MEGAMAARLKPCLLAAAATAAHGFSGNMNGKYSVSSGVEQDVPFNDDFASKGHEYFDVWAPEIATTYGENFWTSQGILPLPDHIIKRFANRTIAITGYEQDQVMVDPVGQPGLHPDRDLSVPINWVYNHHYMIYMIGATSELREIVADPDDVSAHGAPTRWVATDKPGIDSRGSSIPNRQFFSEGNGGESRKSFHGYPNGYAQLLESPVSWNIIPMQIDTRRRDCGVTRDSIGNCSKFEPWMEPKQARYGRRVSRANYSGILECPCNSRYGGDPIFYPDAKTKLISHQFSAIASGVCDASKRVASAGDCFEGAASIGIHARQMRNLTISDESQVGGCFVTMQDDGTAVVTYNTAGTRPCTPAKVYAGAATSAVGVTFNLTIDTVADVATISIAGPADVWFGVGVGATAMADAPYTFIVNSSGVHERQIGTCGSEAEHCAGDALSRSTTLLSNSVNDAAIRTVVFTRPLRGATPKHYTFDPSKDATLNFISAVGSSQQFAYHKAHHAAVVTLLSSPASSHTCLCDLNLEGQLCENGGVKCFKFKRNCKKPWNGDEMSDGGDLLAQRNPTCNSRQYSGGLGCCGHKRVLLDADQDPGPSLLRYHMKVRFWFQEYTPPQFHKDVFTKRHGQVVGPDARPPLTTTVQHALALCANTSACRAITFADAPTLTPTLTSAVSPTLVSTIASVPRTSALPTYRVRPLLIHFKQSATTEPISQPVLTHATTGPTPTYTSYVAAHSSAPSHFNLPRYYYQTEANAGEYDVPPAFRRHNDPPIPGYPETPVSTKGDMHLTPGSSCTGNCPDGADCECVHTITYHWKVDSLSVIYAGGHCHAPSCVSIELWKNDTGTPELLCLQTTKYGKGDTHHDKFDEAGYLVLPPCLFGDEAEGLYPPVYLPPNTPLISVKRNRNTYSGHFGEMASWQMRGVPFDPDAPLVKAA